MLTSCSSYISAAGYDGEESDILNYGTIDSTVVPNDTASIDAEYEFVSGSEAQQVPLMSTANEQQPVIDAANTLCINSTDIDSIIQSIDTHFATYEVLQHYSNKFGIKGIYIVGAGSVILLLATARLAGFIALIHTCIWLYGSYQTYKSLAAVAQNKMNHNNTANQSHDNNNTITQPMLCFWCVYMLFRIVEHVSDAIMYTFVASSILYTVSKIGLLCYIMLPPTNGYIKLYDNYINQIFDEYEYSIHEHSYNIFNIVSSIALEVQTTLFNAVGTYLRDQNNNNDDTQQSNS